MVINTHTGPPFVQGLLNWNRNENSRQMPWKGEKDPYKIWLSEIILQQTRVEQGLKYYENFIRTYPDVHALAKAPEEKVFKLWEGLGYYSRCRNLIATAQLVSRELGGIFPDTHESLLRLKGIGHYTASAISSFAYNLPHAVLDGNVFRILSRIFDVEVPVDSAEGKKLFSGLANSLLPEGKAAEYNQAIMDFGAVICKPVPACSRCFFSSHCAAFQKGKQDKLPVKGKKREKRERWLNYMVLTCKGEIAIRQRKGKDIWQELFEFPLIETKEVAVRKSLLRELGQQFGVENFRVVTSEADTRNLTHRTVHFNYLHLEMEAKENLAGFTWIRIQDLDEYAFPKSLQQFISRNLK